ncbi:MAG TPA: S8 family serine peptidase, partial [Phycisphaerae bacterium]|nr:S8 family serine peptidase [Phycisphaerae bacterium]
MSSFFGERRTARSERTPTLSAIVAIGVWAAVGLNAQPTSGQISWRSTIDRGDPATQSASLGQAAQEQAASGRQHVLVRFAGPVRPVVRQAMRAAGVDLLSYVGDNSFFAVISPERLIPSAVDAVGLLRGMQPIEREHKLHPMLLNGEVPPWALVAKTEGGTDSPPDEIVAAYVIFHRDVALNTDGIALCNRHEAKLRSLMHSINGAVIELPLSRIEALAAEDAVQWIEPPLPQFSMVNDSNRALTQADQAQAAPYNLDGSGVTVLVYDGGTGRSTHVDFQGRLHVRDSSGTVDHSTHVAGTIGGAGVANPTYKGMAPAVTIEAYGFETSGGAGFLYTDPGDLEADYNQAINTYGADISNNSIGSNVEVNGFDCTWQGNYGATSALIDAIVRGSLGQPFRVVWAAGNERQGSRCDIEGYGDYYSVAPPGGAKNHITVGALNSNDDSMTSFSSWGPVDDGRLKPDISGPGCQSDGDYGVTSCSSSGDTAYTTMCGTSMASPTVCGISALLLQDFRAHFPSRPDFRNSTLKILLAQCAVDHGNVGPDYQFGYGSVRIKDTIDFMRTGSFLEGEIDQGGTYSVTVPVSAGTSVLKVTMAWDDVAAAPNVTNTLVNDLDLRVYDPSNGRHYPWTLSPTNPSAPAVQTAEDHINNIEQVLVNSPAAGTWRVEVYGYNVPQGPQSFSLCSAPTMAPCSSQGTVSLDAAQYGCNGTVGVKVVDCDLNTNDAVAETVTVTLTSTTEPAGESVVLTETGPATADFRGTISVSTVNSPGVLQVTNGDTVTGHYIDADNGQGGHGIEVTASATVDCLGPVISNVQVTGVGSGTATVTFTTSEAANGLVRYGLSCGSLTSSAGETGYSTTHSIALSGLPDASRIYFAVQATDQIGNLTIDNNGGACYSFWTPGVVNSWNMNTNPNWTISGGQWAWGQPTGGGGSSGSPDPTGGYTGTNVYGYNLNGDYANNIPEYHLTTTAINCSNLTAVSLKFWRWLGVDRSSRDHAYLRVSVDGTNFTTIWENGSASSTNDGAWVQQTYDISSIADGHSTVYIRWTMGTTNSTRTYCGWNIDDVEIWGVSSAPSDTTPPSPNPMTFATAPAPAGTDSITMTATTATDAASPPVSYYFNFVSGGAGGNDSAWQTSTTYTDTGLTANTGYTYRVKARDSASPTPNETSYSGNAASATFIETPTGVSFGTVATSSIVLNAGGTLTNLTTGSSGLYFDSTTAGGDGGINAWVQTTTDTATGLSPNTSYTFQAKARNQNSVETAYSPTAAKPTLIETPTGVSFSTPTTTSITLAATGTLTNLTTGSSGVFFNSTTAGGNGGINAWIQTITDTATGLTANTSYDFQVKARNQESVETAYTATSPQATLIETPTGVSFGTVTLSTIDLTATGTLTNLTTGSSGVYFDSTTTGGDAGINAWVQTTTDTATGLSPNTNYTFQVKARNQSSVET